MLLFIALSRYRKSRFLDENGVILYHENIDPGLNGFWVEAKDLREGDVFLGANGELLMLVSQERVEFLDGLTVYNFTVDGNHNYFVIAAEDVYGQTSVLVHNADEEYGDDPQSLYHLLNVNIPNFMGKVADETVNGISYFLGDEKWLEDLYETYLSLDGARKTIWELVIGAILKGEQPDEVRPGTQAWEAQKAAVALGKGVPAQNEIPETPKITLGGTTIDGKPAAEVKLTLPLHPCKQQSEKSLYQRLRSLFGL